MLNFVPMNQKFLPKEKINPNLDLSHRETGRGFWIFESLLDFGFWILDLSHKVNWFTTYSFKKRNIDQIASINTHLMSSTALNIGAHDKTL